ncbi:hydroxyproline-rich glycoprotein family protein [Artemisia annua]|uniref:Hydroxyproline-rich glycoprotein family protein n=1 Tax=Artemisia annua TaxID=35608 RepID=A0A2U1L4J2_ARTAN|nr:hydroxyproline-rich glycoprotein family protein [Artemisia annua]
MVDQESNENPTAKQIKQAISVPFLWEEKPGTPKTNWKRVSPVMQLPIKLIASVPFMWEEKPGTPLPDTFSHQTTEPNITNPSSPPHIHQYNKNNPFCDSSDDELGEPLDSDYLQAPSSPAWETESVAWETESVASSYATGVTTTTLAGSSFLECMFPLLTPKSSFLEPAGGSRIQVLPTNSCTQIVSYGAEIRKPLTLGEMIMMSRRRSYLKRAIESRDYDHSTELMVRNGFGCCSIDAGKLQKLKRQLQIKLI